MFEGIQRVWSLKDFGTRFSPAAPTQEGPRAFQLVDDFCAEKASDFNQLQQLSTSGSQQVQHQSLTDLNRFRCALASGSGPGARGFKCFSATIYFQADTRLQNPWKTGQAGWHISPDHYEFRKPELFRKYLYLPSPREIILPDVRFPQVRSAILRLGRARANFRCSLLARPRGEGFSKRG